MQIMQYPKWPWAGHCSLVFCYGNVGGWCLGNGAFSGTLMILRYRGGEGVLCIGKTRLSFLQVKWLDDETETEVMQQENCPGQILRFLSLSSLLRCYIQFGAAHIPVDVHGDEGRSGSLGNSGTGFR